MPFINANITPVPLYAFQISEAVNPGSYTLISGVQNQKIRLISISIINSAGTLTLQDSAGVVIAKINGDSSYGFSGVTELTTGADLQAIISNVTNIDAYFAGFIA